MPLLFLLDRLWLCGWSFSLTIGLVNQILLYKYNKLQSHKPFIKGYYLFIVGKKIGHLDSISWKDMFQLPASILVNHPRTYTPCWVASCIMTNQGRSWRVLLAPLWNNSVWDVTLLILYPCSASPPTWSFSHLSSLFFALKSQIFHKPIGY